MACRPAAEYESVRRSQLRQWKDNPEKFRAYNRAAYRRHREKRKAWQRAYNLTHKYKPSPERRAKARAYDRSPERSGRSKLWFKNNPERAKELWRRRHVRKRGATAVGEVDALAVYQRDGHKCWLCGKRVSKATRSLDHVIPLSKGGTHTMENLRTAHRRCNSSKCAAVLTLF